MVLTSLKVTDMRARARAWLPWPNVLAGVLAACGGEPASPSLPPAVSGVAVAANPANALSLLVQFSADNADSARVHHQVAGGPRASTPYFPIHTGVNTVPVLGLEAETTYLLEVEVEGPGGWNRPPALQFSTGSLPDALRQLRLVGTGAPTATYTLVVPVGLAGGTDAWLLAFDRAGTLRWYHHIAGEGWAIEARQLSNGNFSLYAGWSYGWQPQDGRYVEVTAAGTIARDFRAGHGFFTDPHDLLLSLRDGALDAAHFLAYDIQPFDLTFRGGPADAPLAVHRILRVGPGGEKLFEWNAADHYAPADWPATMQPTDLVHPSSLELDGDGNYVVSLQAMSQVAAIDAQTGAFLWRLGGAHADLTIMDDPLGGFHGQHSARILPNGNLLLLDNRMGQVPPAARAVEYRIDLATRTAHLVWEYRPVPAIVSPIMGSVQRLAAGSTLIGFGAAGRVVEVSADNQLLWSAALVNTVGGAPMQFYRALGIASLYRYERP